MKEIDKKVHPKSTADEFLDTNIVVSSTDCTGLMPTLPLTVDEAESYTEIVDIPQSKDESDVGLHRR